MSLTPKQAYTDALEQQQPVAVPVSATELNVWKVSVTKAPTNLSTDCFPCLTLHTTMARVSKHSLVYAVLFGLFYTAALALAVTVLLVSGSYVTWVIALWGALILASFVMTAARYRMRSFFGIAGNPCEDCCWSFWCSVYVIAQMRTQVEDIVAVPDTTLPAYNA